MTLDESSRSEAVAALRGLVEKMVSGYRKGGKAIESTHPGFVDDAKIVRWVKEDFIESLREDGDHLVETVAGSGTFRPTVAGTFRMTLEQFGIDPADQREQETWFAVLDKALTDAMARD
jgi:hypothetical protein